MPTAGAIGYAARDNVTFKRRVQYAQTVEQKWNIEQYISLQVIQAKNIQITREWFELQKVKVGFEQE